MEECDEQLAIRYKVPKPGRMFSREARQLTGLLKVPKTI